LGLGVEEILLAQLAQRLSDQALAYSSKYGKLSQIVLAVAMPPNASRDWAQTMSGMPVLIVEKKLLTDPLFKKTLLTCSWKGPAFAHRSTLRCAPQIWVAVVLRSSSLRRPALHVKASR
jgi:hypothetical protein